MSWLDKTVCKWVRNKGNEATLSGSQALDVFRKRSSVSAFRVAALCQYLYELELSSFTSEKIVPLAGKEFNSDTSMSIGSDTIRQRVRQIYLFMAEYILNGMMERWGKQFEELNKKRVEGMKPGPKENLFDQLTETFTREQLNVLIEKQGKVTPDKVFINRWKKLKVIEIIDKNTFRKLKK